MPQLNALFEPGPVPVPAQPGLDEAAQSRRAHARSILAALVFDNASEVGVLGESTQITVRRLYEYPTYVRVTAQFTRADGGQSAYQLCNSARRPAPRPENPDAPEDASQHIIRLGEPVLDLVTAALTATELDDLPLPQGHRWRRAEDGSLVSLPRR